jgi:hypothetical protein
MGFLGFAGVDWVWWPARTSNPVAGAILLRWVRFPHTPAKYYIPSTYNQQIYIFPTVEAVGFCDYLCSHINLFVSSMPFNKCRRKY